MTLVLSFMCGTGARVTLMRSDDDLRSTFKLNTHRSFWLKM